MTASVRFKIADTLFWALTAFCALMIILIMGAIAVILLDYSGAAMERFGAGFLWSETWNPVTNQFGAASSIFGTVYSTIIAMLLAVPLSFAAAMFLAELAPPLVSKVVGTAVELLAAVPSIIFGMWGLFVLNPLIREHIQRPVYEAVQSLNEWGYIPVVSDVLNALFGTPPMGIGMMTAGVILALMILPYITAVTRDVFRMVPPVLKESAYGLGSTTWEATVVSARYGIHGIVGALFLGLGRAFGETMAVTMVIGNSHELSLSLFEGSNTIASTLANEFQEAGGLFQSALFELALILFVVSLIFQLMAQVWVQYLTKKTGGQRVG